MRKLTIFTIITLLVASFLFSPFISMNGDEVIDVEAREPTREAGEDLKIENETYKLELTGVSYMEFDTVQILDNGSLEIIGGQLKAKKLICRAETVNSSLILRNFENTPGLISITEGIVNVKATNIEVVGSSITVQNGTSTIPNGEDGGYSEISLISKGSDLLVNNSELNVRGHDGGQGETNLFAGDGGDSYVNLASTNGYSTSLSGTEIQVEGGQGGNAYAAGIKSGLGGDAYLDVKGKTIDINSCEIYIKGGSGGSNSPQSQGAEGGQTQMRYESQNDMTILATLMDAKDGIDTTLQQSGLSRVILASNNGKVLWDHNKPDDKKLEVLSTVNSDVFQIEALAGARLHQVESKEAPSPFGSTLVEVLWWAKVKVKDLYGDPLEGASVIWTIDPDPVPYPKDGSVILTNEKGEVNIEVVGRQNEDWLRYTFEAVITGGAKGNSDQYRFQNNQNENVGISITRMQLEIVSPDDIVKGKPIGGRILIEGTAQSGNPLNTVSNVTLYVDEEVIGYAKNTAEDPTPAFTTWELFWDTETVSKGPHVLTMVGLDDSYNVRVDKDILVNPDVVNHMPQLHSVTIYDVDGSQSAAPSETIEVHVDQEEEENSILTFDVEVYERDVLSEFLGPGEGKEIVKAGIEITHMDTGSKIIGRESLIVGEDSIEKYNVSGGFEFSFIVDTLERPGSGDPFPEGEYRVSFFIEDDGGLTSIFDNSIFFDLEFDFYPSVAIEIDGKRPSEDRTSTYKSFILETPTDNDEEGSSELTVLINLTGSTDVDDPLYSSDRIIDRSWSNLLFTVQIMDPENQRITAFGPEVKGADFEYTFDLSGIDDGEQGDFVITITAKDQQGLESELTVLARITHNAPKPPISLIDEVVGTESINIEYGSIFFIFPALVVLVALGYLGVVFFIQKKNNNDKKKKMEILERKREQDLESKGPSTIEDEINMGIKDSKKYLEATGAGKGREDFLKELKDAQGDAPQEEAKTPEKTETPPQQAPPSPQPPVQQAPPIPKPTVEKEPVQPTPPTPQAPVQQAPPQPQQQPPTPQAPAAPQPPAAPPTPTAPPQPPAVPKPPQ